jgi:hypothetical protein
MKRLKKLWGKALRKVGVSIHDRVFVLTVNNPTFEQLRHKTRTAIITAWDRDYKIGALVRVRELTTGQKGNTNREAYYFINEIITPDDTSCLLPGYCVLVLG